ncbi:hypothetical protein C2G38_2146214 [Gigaspora rosea]|uniref:G-protein coupled receptors family 2 profile 2 domain-containing protein n=1 Tax=Gigaspora rosea TaxID=44941 RepID=A0A397UIL1_9GLOM|nr:hypothetical protein C2G38_2146214 [Gigaspora rosea]
MSSFTKDQFISISSLCVPLNILSIISTTISCIIFSFIRMNYPNLANRVSFRLGFAVSFCDIGYSGHLLVLFFWDAPPSFFCGYIVWAIIFFNLSSLFFIVCIALNLHLIFVNEYKYRYYFEKYYFIIAFSLAFFLSILYITANRDVYDDSESACWYLNPGQEYNLIWQWITLFGWIYASILYCAIVIIMVIRKLRSVKKEVDDVLSSLPNFQLAGYPTTINKTVVSFVVRRVMWYPVAPLVAQFFGSFVETYAYVSRVVPYPLSLLVFVGLSLQGLLNALVFSQDIAVTRAFQAVKLHWWVAHVNYYESHYPHRSYNKAISDEFSMIEKSNDFTDLKSLNHNQTNVTKNSVVNDDIINDDIINDIIINNVNSNNNCINNKVVNNNNNLVLQPSFLEWLRYMLLIKLFSAPKSSF